MADVVPLRQAEQIELFPTIDLGAWKDRTPPPREWMVHNVFPRRQVVIAAGVGGIGKSLLMQHLLTCAVLGNRWLGHRVQTAPAVYFGCEDEQDELWRRQHDINKHLGVSMAEVDEAGLTLSSRIDKDNTLATIDRGSWDMKATPLLNRVAERCLDLGAEFLCLDTCAQVFGGKVS